MLDGFPPVLEYAFVPWGNAYYNVSGCATGAYSKETMKCWVKKCGVDSPPADCYAGPPICQHGHDECLANTYEACAIHYYPDPQDFGPFVTCFEGEMKSDLTQMGACARYYKLDDKKIEACASNATLAAAVNKVNAQATAKLGVAKLGTPWVYVNGEHVDGDDLPLLLDIICEQIEGKKPEGCSGPAAKAAAKARAERAASSKVVRPVGNTLC